MATILTQTATTTTTGSRNLRLLYNISPVQLHLAAFHSSRYWFALRRVEPNVTFETLAVGLPFEWKTTTTTIITRHWQHHHHHHHHHHHGFDPHLSYWEKQSCFPVCMYVELLMITASTIKYRPQHPSTSTPRIATNLHIVVITPSWTLSHLYNLAYSRQEKGETTRI